MLSGQAMVRRTTRQRSRTTRLWTVAAAVGAAMLATACGAATDTAAPAGLAGSLTAAGPGQGTGSPDATTKSLATAPSKAGNRTTTGRTNTARKSSAAGATPTTAGAGDTAGGTAGDTAGVSADGGGSGTTGASNPAPATTSQSQRSTTKGSSRDTVAKADTEAAGAVVGLVNAARKSAGCPALVPDKVLAAVALAHSADMARSRYFEHESQNGETPFDRMKKAGYTYGNAAENIAAGQKTAADVMGSWLHSEGHRKNILDCSLSQIGVGVYRDPSSPYKIYWTQDFGTPA
jgi:uncharacterized protein YkwD